MKEVVRVLKDFDLEKNSLLYIDSFGYNNGDMFETWGNLRVCINKYMPKYSTPSQAVYLTQMKHSDWNFTVKKEATLWSCESNKTKPLYLEEELVPSQFFGLNDYLNCRI